MCRYALFSKAWTQLMDKLLGKILQLTEGKDYTQNSRYLPFCDMVYLVPTWSLFAGSVAYIAMNHMHLIVMFPIVKPVIQLLLYIIKNCYNRIGL